MPLNKKGEKIKCAMEKQFNHATVGALVHCQQGSESHHGSWDIRLVSYYGGHLSD